MTRRRNAAARCARCKMRHNVCVCALLPSLQTRTRLLLLIHRDEVSKPTNTGRLAALCLANSDVVCRGRKGLETPLLLHEQTQPLLLFPHADATPITDWVGCARPITLIVPDGTWRQAGKTRKRVPALHHIPCVSLPVGETSRYQLRNEHRADGLATMEAIARAFGLLEGAPIEQALSQVFRCVVDRTLWMRGKLPAERVFGGIPAGAKRHDRVSVS